jgi:hypothetical protein
MRRCIHCTKEITGPAYVAVGWDLAVFYHMDCAPMMRKES